MNNYIRDGGKVRECKANIIKMNLLQHIYYSIFHWNYFGNALYDVKESFIKFISSGFWLVNDILKIVLFPILIAINSIIQLRDNKEDD